MTSLILVTRLIVKYLRYKEKFDIDHYIGLMSYKDPGEITGT